MPVEKFGRMGETQIKDSGVSLTYINNNYVRNDGKTPLTGSLDMRGNTIYNVADPVNPQDVVTKIYVDNTKGSGVIGRKTKDGVSIKENMDFLKKQGIKNLPAPVNARDAATREYVDQMAINHPFEFVDDTYKAKNDLDLKGNKIKNLCSPFEDGDAATKGYLDTQSVAFLKVDQGEYIAKADINLNGIYTAYNAKDPIDEGHITNKKYVDEQIKTNSAFTKRDTSGYEARGFLFMRRNKLLGLREPLQDGEAANKKYVDGLVNNMLKQYIDEDDNIILNRNVDMEGNQIFNLPDPINDRDVVNKKYVDDLQTQHVDQKGNIKFGRNINLDNKRIFGMKAPTKPKEGANKEYVDSTISQRIQEEKNNFLPQDPATKNYVDEAIRGIAAGDVLVSKEGVFIKENGHYRATAPLDIDNQKMENVPDPVDEKDAVNKKYVDGIVKNLTLEEVLLRENGGYNVADAYINMNFNNIKNLGLPKDKADAVPMRYVENMVKEVEEKIKELKDKIKKRKYLITAHASYHGDLFKGDYQFTFGGSSMTTYNKHNVFNGFLLPANGYIKKFVLEDLGLKINPQIYAYLDNIPIPLFTLVIIKNNGDIVELGTYNIIIEKVKNISYSFNSKVDDFKKYPLYTKDIINIKTEYSAEIDNPFNIFKKGYNLADSKNEYYTYLITLLIELDPLNEEKEENN